MTYVVANCNVDHGEVTSIFLQADASVCAVVYWEDYNKETLEFIEWYNGKMPEYTEVVCLNGELGWR